MLMPSSLSTPSCLHYAAPTTTFPLKVCHLDAKATHSAIPDDAIAIAYATLKPSIYARMIPGTSSAGKDFRISVTPTRITAAGETEGAVMASRLMRMLVKATSPAETKKAPPMVWQTVREGYC